MERPFKDGITGDYHIFWWPFPFAHKRLSLKFKRMNPGNMG